VDVDVLVQVIVVDLSRLFEKLATVSAERPSLIVTGKTSVNDRV
jgi:hypothetical protein